MDQSTQVGLPLEETYPYNPFNNYVGICSATGIYCGSVVYNYYDITDTEI